MAISVMQQMEAGGSSMLNWSSKTVASPFCECASYQNKSRNATF
jgi:hypothetical protein